MDASICEAFVKLALLLGAFNAPMTLTQHGGCERKGHASRAALSLPGMNAGVSRAER